MDDTALHAFAEHCLSARRHVESHPDNPLRALIDLTLIETGRQLAARTDPPRGSATKRAVPASAGRSPAASLP